MPIKDLEKAREYKRLWIANQRKQNVEPVEPILKVEPKHVEPCQLNHTALTELFQQATIKIKQDYKLIHQNPEASRKCFDCHNLTRNYQIMLNLLEKYWKLSKKGERGM